MADDTTAAPFPFIVGCGRSGTTLLRTMLDSHPELAIPGESHLIVSCAKALDPFTPTAFLDAVLDDRRVKAWGMPEPDVRAQFATTPPETYADAVRLLFGCYARLHGKARYADKTPPYVFEIPTLAAMFPEARFVHVIRDGRDVAASMARSSWFKGTLEGAARFWRASVTAGREAGAALEGRYMELRYEALLADPPSVLRDVCRFISLPYSPAMLEYEESARGCLAMSLHPQDHGNLNGPPRAVHDWRRDMSRADSAVVWLLAGRKLVELGYPPIEHAVPVEARARVLRDQAMRTAKKSKRTARRVARRAIPRAVWHR